MPESTTRRRRGTSKPSGAEASGDVTNASTSMTDSGTTRAAVAPPPAQQPLINREDLKNTIVQSVLRALLMYVALRYLSKSSSKGSDARTGNAKPSASPQIEVDPVRVNLWDPASQYELRVFESFNPLMSLKHAMATTPCYSEQNFVYTLDAPNYRKRNVTLKVPTEVSHQNSSWYAHIFVTREGAWSQDPVALELGDVLYLPYNLVSWTKGPLAKESKSLLGGKTDEVEKSSGAPEAEQSDSTESLAEEDKIRQQWKPTMDIVLVVDNHDVKLSSLPPGLAAKYKTEDGFPGSPAYYPPLFVNEFWLFSDQLRLMNSTVSEAKIEMLFSPMSMRKLALQVQFDATFEMQVKLGASRAQEQEKMKRMFLETNPVLLATTMMVSMAHSVLEALAFRNDISHWKSIKSIAGISVRSMMVKIFMELVVFLYLLDNETSWMILIGNAIGIGIEIWKLCKAVEFKNFGKRKIFGFIPWFEMVDRDSYSKKTKEYDEQAMRYLGYVSYPLVIMYSIYALLYEKHKSWYSWVLGSLVGAVYAFGFIMMFPQIFINYKLKSVAHLPMKAMMYKTLNTIIDDLFSFIIKMPWLHRLACFRDDFVFAIYLYQRWIYPVDKTRVNEFGQTFDENGEQVAPPSESSAVDASAEKQSQTNTSECTDSETHEKVAAASKPLELKKKE